MKKLLIMLLLSSTQFVICFAANYDFNVDGMYFQIESVGERTCKLVQGESCYEGKFIIPRTVPYKNQDFSVIGLGEHAFYKNDNLESVFLPSTISKIEFGAFDMCPNLVDIFVDEANNSYRSISGVLYDKSCEKLLKFPQAKGGDYVIPATVVNIGIGAFQNCKHINTITFNEGLEWIGDAAFSGSSIKELKCPSTLNKIENYGFAWCDKLERIILNEGLVSIGRFGFCESAILTITIPASVALIDDCTFQGCGNLNSVIFRDGQNILKLGYNYIQGASEKTSAFFSDCPIEYIYLGRDLSYRAYETTGYSPFYKNDHIKEVVVGSDVLSIPKYAFGHCNSLKKVVIGENVSIISELSFVSCKALEEFIWGTSLKEIQPQAFWGCGLKNIEFPSSLNSVGEYAFYDCFYLESISTGEGLKQIDKNAFQNCLSLESVTFGKNVANIASYAFLNCPKIKTIYSYSETPPVLGATFETDTYTDATLYVPTGTLALYQKAIGWKNFWNIKDSLMSAIDIVSEDVPSCIIINGKTYNLQIYNALRNESMQIYSVDGVLLYNGFYDKVTLDYKGIVLIRIGGKAFKLEV